MVSAKVKKICLITSVLAAAVGVIFGAVISGLNKKIFSYTIDKVVEFNNGSIMYETWANTMSFYTSFYMFHISNPEEVKLGAIPQLVEMGPYTYREDRTKKYVQWNDNSTISFHTHQTWEFIPEKSSGKESDQITNFNMPLIMAADVLDRNDLDVMLGYVNDILEASGNYSLFSTNSLRTWLFDGYSDLLLDLAKTMNFSGKIDIPQMDKFAWQYDRNGTSWYNGITTMFTGEDDRSKLGKIDVWNGSNPLSYYPSYCGKLNGSAGELYPPHIEEDKINFFSVDLCRSIKLPSAGSVDFGGTEGTKFIGDEALFANTTDNPDNECFVGGNIHPSGVFNNSACKYGGPAFVSFPHFYLADPVYREQVSGMEPHEDLHQFYMILEKETSIPLSVHVRLQINLLIRPIQAITLLKNVRETMLPIFWFTSGADVDSDAVSQLSLLQSLPLIITATSSTIIAVGALTLIIIGVLYYRRRQKSQELLI